MLGCRLTKEQMLAISDADLMDQCKRAWTGHDHANRTQIDTRATAVSQQPAESPRTAAAPAATFQDDEATLPIPEEELSPKLRSFISRKQRDKPTSPANRQMLEAWRAGETDVSPSKAGAGGPLTSIAGGVTQSAPAAAVPLDEGTAVVAPTAPAAVETPSATLQPESSVPSPDGASMQHLGSPLVPKLTLLQAVLRGKAPRRRK